MAFTNTTGQPLDGFMIQLNKNTFGLAPVHQNIPLQGPIPAGGSVNTMVPLVQNPNMGSGAVSPILQVCACVATIYLEILFAKEWSPSHGRVYTLLFMITIAFSPILSLLSAPRWQFVATSWACCT